MGRSHDDDTSMTNERSSRMSPIAFTGVRIAGTVAIVVLLLAAGNYYLNWGYLGGAAKPVVGGALLLLLIFIAVVPRSFDKEMQSHLDDKREEEQNWEHARDKSTDEAEIAKLRQDIGLPPNTSLERTRER